MGPALHTLFVDLSVAAPIAVPLLLVLIVAFSWRLGLVSRRLTHSQAQLQLVLDHMKEGIVVLDREGRIVLMNTVGSRLISVPWEHVSYDAVQEQFEAFTPDGVLLPPSAWPSARALRGDFVTDCHLLYRRRGSTEMGSRLMSTAPVPQNIGLPGHVIISYRDDTERRRVDEARTRLSAIVASSADSINSTDMNGIITSWNRGAENIYGYTSAQMIGQSIRMMLPDDRPQEEDEILERILRGETLENFNTPRRTADGRTIHVSLTVSPIRDGSGRVIGASRIARDITETRNLERQLLQAQKMEAIGQLTGGIAHDFNNLLGIVIGSLDLLAVAIEGNEPAQMRAQTAQKAALRGADLTRRLLAFSSEQQLVPAPTDLGHSIRNTLEIATRALGPEIAISFDIEPKLPAIFVDHSGLENALLNLIVNARDAMPGGGALRITAKAVDLDEFSLTGQPGTLPPGRYACLAVSDNGTGMSRETMERAFEPFFTTKPRGQGTGLGLAMVYGFARQSSGIVRIYSEPGHGTTVSIYLPFADVQASQTLPVAVEGPAGGSRPACILLVDDERDLLEVAVTYLRKVGYTVRHAYDGKQALQLLSEIPGIELMVTDIIMPGGLNGVELARQARELRPALRVLYTSGYPADALAQKSFAPVDGGLLHKPYRLAELSATIGRTLSEEPQRQLATVGSKGA